MEITLFFLGLIVLVVVLVSIFPLPIDRIKNWIVINDDNNTTQKLLPCKDLKVTDVWTASFPKYVSDSPIRSVDVNSDGIEDVIIGFGTGIYFYFCYKNF